MPGGAQRGGVHRVLRRWGWGGALGAELLSGPDGDEEGGRPGSGAGKRNDYRSCARGGPRAQGESFA